MYNVKQVLKQEPASITAVITAWLTVLVLAGAIDISRDVAVGVGGAINLTLLLFYVRPASVSKDALNELSALEADRG